jgi:hypothetical protein
MSDVVMPAPASFQLSRTALWIHGVGLVFLGVSTAAFVAIGKDSADAYAVLGVGGAAFMALSIWSMVLAFRSRKLEGRSAWRTVLWMTGLFEASTIFAALWIYDYQRWAILGEYQSLRWTIDLAFQLCSPILLPFLLISLWVALPLSAFVERRGRKVGLKRRRWLWIAGTMVLFGLLILPWVVPFYCVSTLPFYETNYDIEVPLNGRDLRVKLAGLTPHWIGDIEEDFFYNSALAGATEIRRKMIVMGCVSKQRLLTIMGNSDSVTIFAACRAFQRFYRDEALVRANEIISNNSTRTSSGVREKCFAWFVGKEANLAQIRQILDQGDALDGDYRRIILGNLLRPDRRAEVRAEDYIVDCIRLDASNSKRADMLEDCRARCGDVSFSKVFEREWAKLFEQKDWKFHDGLPRVAYQYSKSLELVALCLADSSVEIRKNAVENILSSRGLQNDKIKLLLNALDDSDIEVRRWGVWMLASELGIRAKVISYSDLNAYTAAPVAGEEKELEDVRAAAQKWLQQNKH